MLPFEWEMSLHGGSPGVKMIHVYLNQEVQRIERVSLSTENHINQLRMILQGNLIYIYGVGF